MNPIYGMAAVIFAIGGIFLFLALWGRNPKHLSSAVGTLASSKKVMRQRWKHDDRKYPATTCVYTYQVGSKTYRIRQDGFFARSGLMRKVTVVYLKGFPRFGHLEKFPSWQYALIGALIIVCGISVLLEA